MADSYIASVTNASDIIVESTSETSYTVDITDGSQYNIEVTAGLGAPGSISHTYEVDSEAEMLALSVLPGSVAIRTDALKTFYLNAADPTILSNWVEFLSPVTSINGRIGNIVLTKTDVDLGNVPNIDATDPANITQDSTHRFVSDTEKNTWNGKQDALGFTPENVANKEDALLDNSTTKYPTNNLVKIYVDNKIGAGDYVQSFLTTDWVGPSIGLYTILITHNLNLTRVEAEVWNSVNTPVDVERLITSANEVTLRIPAIPDMRFSGSAWIKSK